MSTQYEDGQPYERQILIDREAASDRDGDVATRGHEGRAGASDNGKTKGATLAGVSQRLSGDCTCMPTGATAVAIFAVLLVSSCMTFDFVWHTKMKGMKACPKADFATALAIHGSACAVICFGALFVSTGTCCKLCQCFGNIFGGIFVILGVLVLFGSGIFTVIQHINSGCWVVYHPEPCAQQCADTWGAYQVFYWSQVGWDILIFIALAIFCCLSRDRGSRDSLC